MIIQVQHSSRLNYYFNTFTEFQLNDDNIMQRSRVYEDLGINPDRWLTTPEYADVDQNAKNVEAVSWY
jgi:hypothetical protein